MYTLLSVAHYLDEIEEIVDNTATEYYDDIRLNELKNLFQDAMNTSQKWISNEEEEGFFKQMKNHFINLITVR